VLWISLALVAALSPATAGGSSALALPNPILFVTQVPIPSDTGTITTVFANHQTTTVSCGRGGDLYILYPDGTLKNLTALGGYGSAGAQGAGSIAVREPSVHWSGTKALFSMVVGGPVSAADTAAYHWQIYEVTGLGKLETPVITAVPHQPAGYNNINPIYGTDDRIIFSSDRPRDGQAHLFPQLDEYRNEIANTGLWSLDPSSGDVRLLDHAPSGDFRPIVDSYGRVLFSRWDHLQRDSQADKDTLVANTFGSFNYADESAAAALLQGNRTEYYPEPQSSRTDLLTGMNVNGFEFNQFFPWQVNEDGTEEETINHVGRHDLQAGFNKSFTNDANLVNFAPSPSRTNQSSIFRFFQIAEDPLNPGTYYGVDCIENGTHGAGQLVTLHGAPTLDAQDMYITYVTDRITALYLPEGGTPNATYTGHYRNPLPLSNGALLTVHADENRADKNMGTGANPVSRYNFRIKTLKVRTGSTLMADSLVTAGIVKSVSYWTPGGPVSFSGTMWELDPVEVRPRAVPARRVPHLAAPELQIMSEEGVDTTALRDYLVQNNLALIVSRNVTNRNTDDHQQPFYLAVHNSATHSPNPTGKVYDVAHLQLFEADYLRGYGLVGGNTNPSPGRRVLPVPLNDPAVHNPPNPSGPAGSVQLGADGSMAAFIPAHRAMSWQLVDSAAVPVVRERFWVTFQPGEIRTCASCHGANGEAAVPKQITPQNPPEALRTLLQYWKSALVPPPGTFQIAVAGAWNMVSAPVESADTRKTALFPGAASNAFEFQGTSYAQKDTLLHGHGYWVKFSAAQVYSLPGVLVGTDTIGLQQGWNMIGSIGTAISAASVASNPGGIITSPFYGYAGGAYAIADSIRPGRAYWVKTSAPAQLILAQGAFAGAKNRIRIEATGELPPPPPALLGAAPLPAAYALGQNYPNPFNPSTEIRYELPAASRVSLKVYNLLGELVATLVDGEEQAGARVARWNAAAAPSGIYFCRIEASGGAGAFHGMRKMLLVK
jgi:hypothetical protein